MNRLFDSAGHEPDKQNCEAVKAQLPAYIDAQLAGLEADTLFPQVRAHLDTCEDCDAEYAALLDLAMADESGLLVADSGTPASSPLPSLPGFVYRVATQLVEALALPEVANMGQLLNALGGQTRVFRESPPVVWGSEAASRQVAVTAYAVTQSIIRQYSASELSTYQTQQRLAEVLKQQAQRDAFQYGFEAEQTERFAEYYAEIAGREVETLRLLMEGKSED